MVYLIEISFTTKGNSEISSLISRIEELCIVYTCMDNYHITEPRNEKYPNEHFYIFSCRFDIENKTNNISEINNFIKEIKRNKKLNVDIITNEDIKCDLLYVSPYYLKNIMCSDARKKYIETQRRRSHSETDYMILRQFRNELSKYNDTFVNGNDNMIISYETYLGIIK